MKHILAIIILALISVSAIAQEQLNIILKDSSYVSYTFDEKPKITINGNTLSVSTAAITVDFPMSEVRNLQFGSIPDDITAAPAVNILTSDNDSQLQIYTIDGLLVRTSQNNTSSATSVTLGDLPKGIYIVRKGDKSHKIIIP